MTEYKFCPKLAEYWSNATLKNNGKKVCCGGNNGYKFFDQIIKEEYAKGCLYFICELGRGEDKLPTIIEEQIEAMQKSLTLDSKCENMSGKYCTIEFGSRKDNEIKLETECLPTNKKYKLQYYFDDDFVNKFIIFWNEESNRDMINNIILYFIDMTHGAITKSVNKLVTDLNSLEGLQTQIPMVIEYNYKTTNGISIRTESMVVLRNFVRKILELRDLRKLIFNYNKQLESKWAHLIKMDDKDKLKEKYIKYKTKYLKLKALLNDK
jgi:hypothetical protein